MTQFSARLDTSRQGFICQIEFSEREARLITLLGRLRYYKSRFSNANARLLGNTPFFWDIRKVAYSGQMDTRPAYSEYNKTLNIYPTALDECEAIWSSSGMVLDCSGLHISMTCDILFFLFFAVRSS